MQNFIGRLFRFIIKLILAAFGLVFAVSLLAIALVALLLSLLKSLMTGKKPAPFVAFSQFRRFKQDARGGWPFADKFSTQAAPKGDVVDVEMREIKDPQGDKRLP
jgi:hypothetical protein